MKIIKARGLAFVVPMLSVVVCLSAQAETLEEVVSTAIATNPEVLIRTTGADAKTDEVRQARAGYLPSVDFTTGVGYENSRNATTVGAFNNQQSRSKDQDRTRREAAITLRQILFNGFATGSEVDRQLARQMAADYEVCSTSEDIALQTTEAYTNVMKDQALMDNAKGNLEEHQRLVELIRRKNKQGMGNDADEAQAESRLLLAHANLIAAEAALRDSKTVYQRLVGNLPAKYVRPAGPKSMPASMDQAVVTAMNTHPVMRITASDVDQAKAQYEASKSRFMPTVAAELGADWGRDQNGGKGTVYNHTAMLRMSFNLYNGGADSARKSQTSKLINEAMEIRNRAMRQIQEEVRLSWVAVDSGGSRLKQLVAHEKNAKRALDLYQQQFQANNRTLLDLLDSQNEYFTAGNSKVRADYDLLYSKYRLLHSGGTLLSSLQVSLPVENSCGISVKQS